VKARGARKKSARRAARARKAPEKKSIRGAVLGADVRRSRSPAIHNAAFRALGIAGDYVAHSVTARGFRPLVKALAAQGYRYLNVTIPHKGLAAGVATASSPAVRASGAANTLIFGRAGTIRAENTDGPGLLAALRDLGAEPAGGVAVVVGSGGAAAGAVEALTAVGACVRIVARRTRAALAMRAHLPPARQPRVSVIEWTAAGMAAAATGADMLVSAVPAAAWDSAEACAGLDALGAQAVVLEMAYGAGTQLARAVEGRVRCYSDGLGMLVHQAAVAIELALKKKPPLAAMFEAVRQEVPGT
jgi:shikimate dehydrogenase